MKTVIIYTNTGEILATLMGENVSAANGTNIIETDIPDGYTFSSVNPETGEPVLEEIPKSDEQAQIDALKEQVAALQAATAQQQKITDAIIGATESEETV